MRIRSAHCKCDFIGFDGSSEPSIDAGGPTRDLFSSFGRCLAALEDEKASMKKAAAERREKEQAQGPELQALQVELDSGIITQDEYDERRQEVESLGPVRTASWVPTVPTGDSVAVTIGNFLNPTQAVVPMHLVSRKLEQPLFRPVIDDHELDVMQPEPLVFELASGTLDKTLDVFRDKESMYRRAYKGTGRFMALALCSRHNIGCTFSHFFLDQVIGREITIEHLKAECPELAKSMVEMLEYEGDYNEDVFGGEETLSRTTSSLGAAKDVLGLTLEDAQKLAVPISDSGAKELLTNENKAEYVEGWIRHKLVTSIEKQVLSVREGLLDIIPEAALHLFSAEELSDMLSGGTPDALQGEARAAFIEDWKAEGDFTCDEQIETWFFELMESEDEQVRKDLPYGAILEFATGSSRLPHSGFVALKNGGHPFQLTTLEGGDDRMPESHTCFNRIDLPAYTSKEKLHNMLKWAVHASAGYGMA